MKANSSQFARPLRCLHCGYDLRGSLGLRSNDFTITCPECGVGNDAELLRQYGARAGSIAHLVLLLTTPPAALIVSAWLLALWSQESVHALLCLIFAPVVICAHSYAMWQLIDATIVLTRKDLRRLRAAALGVTVLTDVLACVLVAILFV